MRKPIKQQVQLLILIISVVSSVIISIAAFISMVMIHDDGERALINQMEKNLRNLVTSRAEFAYSKLNFYADYSEYITRCIHEIYINSQDCQPVEISIMNAEDAGKYVLQRGFKDENIEKNSVMPEMFLLGNIEKYLKNFIPDHKAVISTSYLAAESGFMISYDSASFDNGDSDVYYDFSDKDWYTKARDYKRAIFSNIYQDAYGRGPTITCSAPFYDEKNNFAGVFAIDILIKDLYNEIIRIDLTGNEGAYAFLVDNSGKIITDSGEELTLFHDWDMSPFIAGRILAGEMGVLLTVNRIYYAYAPILKTGWKFCVKIPENIILMPLKSVNRHIIFIIILFCVAIILIIILMFEAADKFSNKITAPIKTLIHDVELISDGDFNHIAEIHNDDEIGDLAKNFNHMTECLKEYINEFGQVIADKERIKAELDVAAKIQAHMLPENFKDVSRNELEIYANMTPAKEVGGDFYDFFLIDENHLALVMADVSGKGIPAALFMVNAKTLIKNRAQLGGHPSEILTDVNKQLCESNETDIFVTVWLGILEISTGKIIASNAGHEYPAVKHSNGEFNLIHGVQSPAVAVMEGIKFFEYKLILNPGDTLYLYTDGVPEAMNKFNKPFGIERMLAALDGAGDVHAVEILSIVKHSVDEFTGDAPQFDDVTMLCVKYFGEGERKNFVGINKLIVEAKLKSLDEVLEFVDGFLENNGCPPKTQVQIDVAVEELFVNIAHYSGSNYAGVEVEIKDDCVFITFCDRGMPFDPLARPDPDVTLPAEDRSIGGLGIYIVKKSMDEMTYKYDDGENILTIKKTF